MHEEVLGHLEFWSQFRQYLDDHKIEIRLSGSSKSSSSEVFLPRSYFRLRPWHLLKGNRLGMSVQFNEPDAMARHQLAQQHRQTISDWLTPLGALDWQPRKISLSRSRAAVKGGDLEGAECMAGRCNSGHRRTLQRNISSGVTAQLKVSGREGREFGYGRGVRRPGGKSATPLAGAGKRRRVVGRTIRRICHRTSTSYSASATMQTGTCFTSRAPNTRRVIELTFAGTRVRCGIGRLETAIAIGLPSSVVP